MTPTEYEKAVLQRFLTYWPRPEFVVRHNIRLLGSRSKARRQIDIAVFEAGKSQPFLLGEAKKHKRSIYQRVVDDLNTLVQAVGLKAA